MALINSYPNMIHNVLGPLIPKGSCVALFDFPNYSNVGDSAIWLGEELYLEKYVQARVIAVDSLELLYKPMPKLSSSAIVLLQGGGNIGDLYTKHQVLREKIIMHYSRHRIIQLPQSIHFQDQRKKQLFKRAIEKHNDFHLIVRDYDSLAQANDLQEGSNYLCPDMALCLRELPRNESVDNEIIGLLRTDNESIIKNADMKMMMDTFLSMDWVAEKASISKQLLSNIDRLHVNYPRWLPYLFYLKRPLYHQVAKERLIRGCKLLSSAKVVITDRLHGHILCFLLGIPHVILDNHYRKIGNFRDAWKTGGDECLSANSLEVALKKAKGLLNRLK